VSSITHPCTVSCTMFNSANSNDDDNNNNNNNAKVNVIPVVIGALGSYSKNVKTWMEKLKIPNILDSAQLSAILGTAHVLRKVLNL